MNEFQEVIDRIKKEAQLAPKKEKTYECPICKDSGWIFVTDENGHECAKHCECFEVREARRLMEKSGISAEFQNKGFKNFDTRGISQLVSAKNKALAYYQNFIEFEHSRNNSIMFCGQVGAGKTHLGTAICSNLLSGGVAVIYMPYRNAVTKIKQKISNENEYEKELSKYITSRVLYIDDLLKGKITESDVNIMYEIVNYRYMNNLPIIISTEKKLEELLAFDEAIGSRMIEMCRGNIVQLVGKELNYRLFS